jgi:predicted phage terminase large subunit-like protein
VPPRHLKSIIASVALPAWYLGHHPSERVIAVSYSADLAKTHANDFRRVVNDPLYQAVFPKMRLERETDNEIHTTLRGRRYATSIQGTLTGRGGNLIIIDDPLKPGDASSEVSRDVLQGIKKSMGTMLFSAQYQQAPEPPGGKIIKKKMLKYYNAVERRTTDRLVLSWDIALSENETGDYSAGVVLLNRGETYYVLEVLRGKFPFEKLKEKILDMKERHGKVALLIEKSPISHGLIQSIQEKRVNVVVIMPDRDKRARLISQIDLFEGGSILLPKHAPWLDAFQAELLSFPGRHDDQVDALTQGLAWHRAAWKPPLVQRRAVGLGG